MFTNLLILIGSQVSKVFCYNVSRVIFYNFIIFYREPKFQQTKFAITSFRIVLHRHGVLNLHICICFCFVFRGVRCLARIH